MAHEVPNIALNNGVEMPSIGLGVFQTPPDETRSAVAAALGTGYRHIDTAAAYGNEREVGEAVHASKGGRTAAFLETKVWISDYGYDETLHAFDKSAGKLGVNQIDLLNLAPGAAVRLRQDARGLPGAGDATEGRQGTRHRRQQLHGRAPHESA
jgi:diketogulonate reductase-like aldo/keto reductase